MACKIRIYGLTATCSIVVTSPFVFELVGGSYALKSYNGTATEVVVPSSYKGKPVTAIGVPQEGVTPNATGFAYSTIVKKIVLPDTINTLSWGAFYQCQGLEEVNIPNDVKYIGFYLFYGCSSLKKLSVSLDHFTTFEEYFAKTKNNDGSIEYLSIPSSLETVVVTGTKIGSSAFGYSPLEEVIILDSVTSIGSYAFFGCSSLTKVNYTGTIDQWAQINFGNSYANPIYYAKNLYINDQLVTTANITSATKIGSYAFYGYDKLTSVTIGDSVTSIGDVAFAGCTSLTSIVIPDSVTSIGYNAFFGCKNLTSVEIPNSVTSIGSQAFYGCSSLITIKYRGTQAQWNNISKGDYWDRQTGKYTITYNYTGE